MIRLLMLLVALLPAPLAAQGVVRAGAVLAQAGVEWQAVGRLDIGGAGFCTVALIAPDRALTAAHCVQDQGTGALHAASSLSVRLGLMDGQAAVARGVRAVLMADPGQRPAPPGSPAALAQVPRDIAVLILDRSVAEVAPIGLGADDPGGLQTVTVVSYARGRAEAAAVQDDCIVIAEQSSGALVLDCQVDHGASGAPVIARAGGGMRIVAVVSARGQVARAGFPDAQVALAAPVAPVLGLLAEGGGAQVAAAGSVRVRRAGDSDGAFSGAFAGGARRVVVGAP